MSKPSISTSFSTWRGAGEGAATPTPAVPSARVPRRRDQVAVVGRLGVGGEAHLHAALGGEDRRVDVGHRVLDDVEEQALEGGELEHAHVVGGDLAADLDVELGGHGRRRAR